MMFMMVVCCLYGLGWAQCICGVELQPGDEGFQIAGDDGGVGGVGLQLGSKESWVTIKIP